MPRATNRKRASSLFRWRIRSSGKQRRIPVDMVILSSGMEPRHDAKQTGQLFGISCSSDGWYIERHPKLDPVTTMTEGILIAGCASGPKDIPASVRKVPPLPPECLTRSCKRKWSSSPSAPPSTRKVAPAAASAIPCARSMRLRSLMIWESAGSTRLCARDAAPAWQPAPRGSSADRASRMSRYLPRSRAS